MSNIDRAKIDMNSFSLAEARKICHDLFEPKPWIFWTDFLLSISFGTVFYTLVQRLPFIYARFGGHAADYPILFPCLRIASFFIACMLYYRAALFIHELVHLRTNEFKGFRFTWNLLCGIPFLMPSFLYYTHLDHHRRKHYGTKHDGEYIPLGHQSPWAILGYLLQPFVIPILAVLRWLVFTPLAWLLPGFRKWVQQHASSMVMDPSYVRPIPTEDVLKIWRFQEAACFFISLVPGTLWLTGLLPMEMYLRMLAQMYATAVVIIFANAVRTLGAHRFTGDGSEMTFVQQLVDSVNYTHWPLITGIWAPVGLSYHALHHLFPAMPYHNLATAHRRLMEKLPADSPYRLTESRSLLGALRDLWQMAAEHKANVNNQPTSGSPPSHGVAA